jgi:tetratricopeptide (TPR) repeat protein
MKNALLPCALAALFPLLSWAQLAAPRATAPRAVAAPSTAIRRAAPASAAAREGLQLAREGCQSDGYEPEVCERAIAKLEEASREDPEQVEVQLALAQAYWNRGHTESPRAGGRQRWRQRSVDTLQRMVDRNVKDARAYYELSVRQKDDAQRVRLLRRTLEVDPRHPRAHQDMAWGLLRQGLGEEAARFYKEHMDANPVKDREEARENLRFAEELSRARLPRQAAQVLGQVVEQTRGERRAERCVLFQSVDQRLTESVPALRGELQALRPYCTNTEHLGRAVELERQGRVDEAVNALEQQVATNPKPEETHAMLERLHQRKGEVEKAAEVVERQLRLEPEVKEKCERFLKASPLAVRAMPSSVVEALRRQCPEPE